MVCRLSGALSAAWKKHFFVLLVLLISACAQAPKQQALPLSLEGHALAGKIYDVQGARFIEQAELAKSLAGARYILLGETHDNLAHHQGQQWVVQQLASTARGKGSRIAFEMIDEAQGKILASSAYTTVDELIGLLGHVQNQWGYMTYYRPVFAAAMDAKWNLVAASQDRDSILKVVREGEAGVPQTVRALMQKTVLSAEQVAASREEIEQSHCGMSTEKMVTAMMLTQRSKDAFMALALAGDEKQQAMNAYRVLVAGSGHTRKDRGVPLYIQQLYPEANILSLTWLEVAAGVEDVEAYAQQWGAEAFPFDYVWFTPRVERPDPCEAFRKHMKKRHKETMD